MQVGCQRQIPATLPPGERLHNKWIGLGGPQSLTGRILSTENLLPLPRLEPQFVQPVAGRYINKTIPARQW